MYEPLFRHVLFPAYETLIKRRSTTDFCNEYEASQWLAPQALKALQLRKLNALLAHCWAEVPFLQRWWADHGLTPKPLGDVTELRRYPLLSKALITANYQDMVAKNWRGRTITKSTSGSSGDPFRFEYTMDVYARRTAVMWRGYGWAGAGLGARIAYLWGYTPPKSDWLRFKDRLHHRAFNRRFYDAFGLSDSNVDGYIDDMFAYRPDALVGYVGPVVLLAKRMLATGRRMSGLRSVLTGSETLYESERHEIEAAFGCPVFNTYGSREVMLMAAECAQHGGLHQNADHLLLETVNPTGQAVPAGESGAVAVTDLHNLGMPMVRYLNGDRATWASGQCTCGRGLPLLQSIDGRVFEVITTPDGRALMGIFFAHTMVEWPDVRKWQVVQTAPDTLEYRLVVDAPWSEAEKQRLRARIHAKSGVGMKVLVTEVDHIADSRSGKRQLIVPLEQARKLGMLAPGPA